MKLKSIIDLPCGMRYCVENLPLCSGFSRRYLLERDMMVDQKEIELYYSNLKYIMLKMPFNNELLKSKFFNLKDIRNTLFLLEKGNVLNDIQLFEIKSFILLSLEINRILRVYGLKIVSEELNEALKVLDPEDKMVSSFYIYDVYSEELSELRRLYETERNEDCLHKIIEEESKIRKTISSSLINYYPLLFKTIVDIVDLEILISVAENIISNKLTIPSISGETILKKLYNPYVKNILNNKGKDFQKIDISFENHPTLIVGSNMGGKTVTLKTIALAQFMFQFGFGVPAEIAQMNIFEEIILAIGDNQDLEKGFSSFAAELMVLNEIIEKSNKSLLALIDEPARSTNPIEGAAFVESLTHFLRSSIITTHYNIESDNVTKLRVKGVIEGRMNYQLCKFDGDIPHEAINIAKGLGVSSKWIDKTIEILKK